MKEDKFKMLLEKGFSTGSEFSDDDEYAKKENHFKTEQEKVNDRYLKLTYDLKNYYNEAAEQIEKDLIVQEGDPLQLQCEFDYRNYRIMKKIIEKHSNELFQNLCNLFSFKRYLTVESRKKLFITAAKNLNKGVMDILTRLNGESFATKITKKEKQRIFSRALNTRNTEILNHLKVFYRINCCDFLCNEYPGAQKELFRCMFYRLPEHNSEFLEYFLNNQKPECISLRSLFEILEDIQKEIQCKGNANFDYLFQYILQKSAEKNDQLYSLLYSNNDNELLYRYKINKFKFNIDQSGNFNLLFYQN